MMRAPLVLGGDACSNHHYRADKHRVLDTLLGYSKLRITFKVAWSVMEWYVGRRGRGRGSGPPQHHDACIKVVGGDACSNHHYRAAKHRVLDTLLEHSKLRITCKIARRVMERCES